VLQGLGIAFFQRGGADRKAHILEFDVRVFPVEDVSVRGEILPVQRRISSTASRSVSASVVNLRRWSGLISN
jgi:hypothetical protein